MPFVEGAAEVEAGEEAEDEEGDKAEAEEGMSLSAARQKEEVEVTGEERAWCWCVRPRSRWRKR